MNKQNSAYVKYFYRKYYVLRIGINQVLRLVSEILVLDNEVRLLTARVEIGPHVLIQ